QKDFATKEGVDFINHLLDQIDAIGKTDSEMGYMKGAMLGVSDQTNDMVAELQRAKQEHENLKAAVQANVEWEKTYFDSLGNTINKQSDAREKVLEHTQAIKDQTETLGMSEVQREIYRTGLELEKQKQEDTRNSTIDTRQAIEDLTAQMEALYVFA